MASRTVFSDENNNEMDCYLNDNNKIYIRVGDKGEDINSGFITLDKADIQKLIEVLIELEKEINN